MEKNILQYKRKNYENNYKAGFSFIELLVVLSVFGILTAITLYNYNDYENRSRFEQTVYNVAIAIRQAQNSGTSAVDYVLNDFNPDDIETVNPIGIRFEYQSSSRSFSSVLTLFRDTNKLGGYAFVYDKNNDSIVDTVKIPELDAIAGICEEVTATSCVGYTQSVTLFFKRPHPEPFIEGISNQAVTLNGFEVIPGIALSNPIRIQLYDSIRNEYWAIRIEPAGLISIVTPKDN